MKTNRKTNEEIEKQFSTPIQIAEYATSASYQGPFPEEVAAMIQAFSDSENKSLREEVERLKRENKKLDEIIQDVLTLSDEAYIHDTILQKMNKLTNP